MRALAPLPLLLAAFLPPAGTGEGQRLIVLNKSDASAHLIDPASGVLVREVATGSGPHEGAVSPDGKLAVVTDYGQRQPGRTLTVIELTGEEPGSRTIELEGYSRPHGVVFLSDLKRVLVTAEDQQALIVVDVEAGTVVGSVKTEQGASHMVAVAPDERRAFVANIASGTMSAVDLVEMKLLANVATGAGAEGIAVRPGRAEVWVTNRSAGTVTVVDANELEVLAQLPCEGFPIRVAFTPDGGRALVSAPRAGDVAVFDAEKRELLQRVPMRFELAEGSEEHLFAGRFGDSPVPIGVLVRPDGKVAYVANSGANLVAVLDLEQLKVVDAFETGNEPDGMAWY